MKFIDQINMADKNPRKIPILPEPQIEEIQPEPENPNEEVEQIIIQTIIGNPIFPDSNDNSENLPN